MKQSAPGINIQWPWTTLILSGEKTVETRTYPLPEKYVGKTLAIIETAGKRGKSEAGINRARIIGIVRFSGSFKYKNEAEWLSDYKRHRVDSADSTFGWSAGKEKWGWKIEFVCKAVKIQPAPRRRGIIFANRCDFRL